MPPCSSFVACGMMLRLPQQEHRQAYAVTSRVARLETAFHGCSLFLRAAVCVANTNQLAEPRWASPESPLLSYAT